MTLTKQSDKKHGHSLSRSAITGMLILLLMASALAAFAQVSPSPERGQASPAKAIDPDLLRKATAGDVLSQRTVGFVYLQGLGVQNDYAQAVAWLRKAAEQGDTQSQNLLGKLNYDGQGIPRNYEQAAIWWRKAADQGNASAQYDLALLYRD